MNIYFVRLLNVELKLKDTESAIRDKLIDLLLELQGFQFLTTLIIEFRKIESVDTAQYTTFYLSSNAETSIKESDIDDVFESIYTTITWIIQKYCTLVAVISNYEKNETIQEKLWIMFKISITMTVLNGV